MIPPGFHFLRPEWLYALIPAMLLAGLAWRRLGRGHDDWVGLVDAHLLKHLAVREGGGGRRWPIPALLLAWALAVAALAGPAWQKVPTPTLDHLDPVVVVLSLAPSMDGTDRAPSRLVAARHKIEDLIGRMRGGQVGLVIFADAPFVASPLTEDGRVVGSMLPELATDLMPVPGDRPDLGISEATQLLRNTGARSGRIVLVTDGPGEAPAKTREAVIYAAVEGYAVSVLDVSGASGPQAAGTRESLSRLASLGHGAFTAVSPDGRDLDALLAKSVASSARNPLQESGLSADQWVDMGYWLLLLVAPLAALGFRRGWLAMVPLAFALGLGVPGAPARAQDVSEADIRSAWRDLWQRPDQQGESAFARKDYSAAAGRFTNPAWKGSALYEAGNYDAAAASFGKAEGADYNRGNALARSGQLEQAVSAYEAALARDPQDADAAFNLDLVKRILDMRKQQQDQDKDQNQGSGGGGGGNGQQPQSPQQSTEGKDQKGQDQKPGEPKPGEKGDSKQPDPKQPDPKQAQQKPQPPEKGQAKPDQAPPEQKKPDQAKPGPDKAPPPDKPDPKAGNTPGAFAPPPPPGQQPPPQDPPPPAPPPPSPPPAAPPPKQGQEAPPKEPPVAAVPRPMTEQDQNREQALRSVPDDPVGLLRARIRSHYSGEAVPAFEDKEP